MSTADQHLRVPAVELRLPLAERNNVDSDR